MVSVKMNTHEYAMLWWAIDANDIAFEMYFVWLNSFDVTLLLACLAYKSFWERFELDIVLKQWKPLGCDKLIWVFDGG